MTLDLILLGTALGGLVSVLLAASLALTVLKHYADVLVSFAVGTMLTAAFIGLLPEALEVGMPAQTLGGWVLVGLLGFFLLEKTTLWRHSHDRGSPHVELRAAVPMVVIGDAMHNFVDGVAIAATFLVDTHLGIATSAAVLLHEIPQEMGDFMVLLAAGVSRGRALMLNALSGTATVAGGVLGYVMLNDTQSLLPVVLALAASSFIYIAVSDLVPYLQRRPGLGAGVFQLVMIGTGSLAVLMGQLLAHAHAH